MAKKKNKGCSNRGAPPPFQTFPFYLGGPLQPPQPIPPVLAATTRTFGVVRVRDINQIVKAIPFTSFPPVYRYNFLVDTILAADLDYAHGKDKLVTEDRQLIAEETDMDIMLAPVEHAGRSITIYIEHQSGQPCRNDEQQSRGRRRHQDFQTENSWVIDDFEHVSMSPAPRERRQLGDFYRPDYRGRDARSPGRERRQTPMERTFGRRDDWRTRGGRIKRERSWSIDRELPEPQKRAKLSGRLVNVPTMAELEQAVDSTEKGRILISETPENEDLVEATVDSKSDGGHEKGNDEEVVVSKEHALEGDDKAGDKGHDETNDKEHDEAEDKAAGSEDGEVAEA